MDTATIIGFSVVAFLSLAAYSHDRVVTWRTRALDAERKSNDLWREKFAREWARTLVDPEQRLESLSEEIAAEYHRLQSITGRVLTDRDLEEYNILVARSLALRDRLSGR